jgi:hypothetical protein
MAPKVVGFLLACLAGTSWAGSSHDKRIEFQERQRPIRVKYKLSDEAASARYPMANLFIGDEKIVAPGEVTVITATGTAAKGSLFVFNCDDLQILSLKHTAKAVTVKVKVGAFALPRHCALMAVSPVSVATLEIPAIEVQGTYTWQLDLANGMKASFTTKPGAKGPETRSTWTNGATDIGERDVTQEIDDEAPKIHFTIARDNSDIAATKATREADPRWKEAAAHEAEREALYVEREACAKVKDQTARGNCDYQVAVKLDKLQAKARRNHALQTTDNLRREHDLQHPHACDSVSLQIDAKGRLTGLAGRCAGTNRVEVSGTVVVERKK